MRRSLSLSKGGDDRGTRTWTRARVTASMVCVPIRGMAAVASRGARMMVFPCRGATTATRVKIWFHHRRVTRGRLWKRLPLEFISAASASLFPPSRVAPRAIDVLNERVQRIRAVMRCAWAGGWGQKGKGGNMTDPTIGLCGGVHAVHAPSRRRRRRILFW